MFTVPLTFMRLASHPGNKNKGKGNDTALQTSSLLHTHTLLVPTHNMITVKEIAEHCRQL